MKAISLRRTSAPPVKPSGIRSGQPSLGKGPAAHAKRSNGRADIPTIRVCLRRCIGLSWQRVTAARMPRPENIRSRRSRCCTNGIQNLRGGSHAVLVQVGLPILTDWARYLYSQAWLCHDGDRADRMKAVEFKGTVAPDGQIAVPPEVARHIPAGEQLQIVVLWETPMVDDAWSSLGRQRFEAAYAPEDSVYEQLMDEASTR